MSTTVFAETPNPIQPEQQEDLVHVTSDKPLATVVEFPGHGSAKPSPRKNSVSGKRKRGQMDIDVPEERSNFPFHHYLPGAEGQEHFYQETTKRQRRDSSILSPLPENVEDIGSSEQAQDHRWYQEHPVRNADGSVHLNIVDMQTMQVIGTERNDLSAVPRSESTTDEPLWSQEAAMDQEDVKPFGGNGHGGPYQEQRLSPDLTSKRPQNREENELPKTPNIDEVFFGRWRIKPSYFSPYPVMEGEYSSYHGSHSSQVNGKGQTSKAARSNKGHKTPSTRPSSVKPQGSEPSALRNTIKHDSMTYAKYPALWVCQRSVLSISLKMISFSFFAQLRYDNATDHLFTLSRCFRYSNRPFNLRQNVNNISQMIATNYCCQGRQPGVPLYDDDIEERIKKAPVDGQGVEYVAKKPGPEKEGRIRIYEVEPEMSKGDKLFCQNLALFGKFFIDWKSVLYDCDNFMFYVTTVVENGVESPVGFFSKEKETAENYNLACIITFPPYQGQGFGRLMIQFSYELSRYEEKIGTPERPLSDLGLRSYYTVWANMILDYLLEQIQVSFMTLDDMSDALGTNHTITPTICQEDGSAHVHYSFDCTLQELADGAFLTVADASFALGELGLLPYIQSASVLPQNEVDPQEKEENQPAKRQRVVLTRELIMRVAQKFPFRRPPINKDALAFWELEVEEENDN
ncbi:hypothetical protein CPB86DRAFT_814326 [Serendipita vermifera]|nr:hypothetical protein CPB86DRAFT_814326 [Serendipita vermifera]